MEVYLSDGDFVTENVLKTEMTVNFNFSPTSVQLISLVGVLTSSINLDADWSIVRNQPNSREKMRDFMVEFLKCAKFHGKFMEGVWEIHGKFTGPTAVISRCYVDAI